MRGNNIHIGVQDAGRGRNLMMINVSEYMVLNANSFANTPQELEKGR